MYETYTSPALQVVGSLHELTLANKYPSGKLDGDKFFPGHGAPPIILHGS